MKPFEIKVLSSAKYLFFTGKGGVGKTSIATATAIGLADSGKKVLLISTDPASNLQDIFGVKLDSTHREIENVPGLFVVNLNPEEAAAQYREEVVAPFRGKLPETLIQNMEEQLSGSCTVEIAAFNQFSDYLANPKTAIAYDHIIFDTAPTGHTLRMLQLPSAWSTFINESTHGASCLGQLSGLETRKGIYKVAVNTLSDSRLTQLILVTRPENSPLQEAARSSHELQLLGIKNQCLIVNGILEENDKSDALTQTIQSKQREAMLKLPHELSELPMYSVPLRAYNLSNIPSIRKMLHDGSIDVVTIDDKHLSCNSIDTLVDDLYESGKKVIFTMGKGGVGKTTIATEIALRLKAKGLDVHLTTTDPANHINEKLVKDHGVKVSRIDEQAVLEAYKNEVRQKAALTISENDMAYIEEDLRSPCTQEIAVFRAFADIVEQADHEVVVIDTAPTGHTLLLLDATQSYHKEVERTHGDTPESVQKLLPRLRNPQETAVVIVTLPEATPVFEAERLQADLQRAGIPNKWWVINASFSLSDTQNELLRSKANNELQWIERVNRLSNNNTILIPYKNI